MTQKLRLAVPANADVHGPGAPATSILSTGNGLVTVLDKLKGYYKGLIATVGVLIMILNEVTPVLNFIPGPIKTYVTVGVGILTTALTFLKANEHWVDSA